MNKLLIWITTHKYLGFITESQNLVKNSGTLSSCSTCSKFSSGLRSEYFIDKYTQILPEVHRDCYGGSFRNLTKQSQIFKE